MKALVFERNLPRFAAARLASVLASGRGAHVGPLRLLDADPPALPAEDWYHLRPTLSGICGSDLATVDGRSSRYFEDVVSFPFVPGHEVVGVLDDGGVDHAGNDLVPGTRAVLEPVLGCAPRHVRPPCPACTQGRTGRCSHLTDGPLAPGLQTGFCADTGGGWSTAGLVAHASQLHAVPDALDDEDAVVVEPAACAAHAALAAAVPSGSTVVVLGAGTLGLATIAALTHLVRPTCPHTVVVGAKHPVQRQLADRFGADVVVPPDQLARSVRRATGSLAIGGRLSDGADVVFDCVGSADSLGTALGLARPGGTVVLVGMPGRIAVDLAVLWHRELRLVGAYAYGVEPAGVEPAGVEPAGVEPAGVEPAGVEPAGAPPRTFDLAFSLVATAGLGTLVSAAYPLDRYEEALVHAGSAGRRGAVKIVFDLRTRKGTPR
ncbi:MAG: zinc-binding dehydrogenase [Actinomycetota bacterium]|nr:zinc-binding dehydrogenase [Actinomycetota bacterium]